MNITIIGTGYVGLVTGACFSEFGHQVICMDKDARKIEPLAGRRDPHLRTGSGGPGQQERQGAGGSPSPPILPPPSAEAEAVFIAVGTPSQPRGDGYADLTYIYAAAKELAPLLKGYTVIVDKSTVPVGTARQVARVISEANPEADFDVVSNPEFLREGAAINDFMRPDRIVMGSDSERATESSRRSTIPSI